MLTGEICNWDSFLCTFNFHIYHLTNSKTFGSRNGLRALDNFIFQAIFFLAKNKRIKFK